MDKRAAVVDTGPVRGKTGTVHPDHCGANRSSPARNDDNEAEGQVSGGWLA